LSNRFDKFSDAELEAMKRGSTHFFTAFLEEFHKEVEAELKKREEDQS
jgi:hypothetical protein